MKETILTGKHIYDAIKRAEDERKELLEALNIIQDELGSGNIAYRVVEEQYKNKDLELRRLQGDKYKIHDELPRGLG